jgi:predicted Zn-dependent peptidase
MSIKTHIFSNGLKLVYEHMSNTNMTSVDVFVKVGSINETNELNGVSHFLEHMIFKGNDKYSNIDVTRTFDSIGAYLNAYTTNDHTCYMCKFHSDYTKKCIDLYSHIILNAKLDRNDFDKEKNVVVDEIIRANDNTENYISEKIHTLLFKGSSLEKPIGGVQQLIQEYDYKKSVEYYKIFYKPNNMVISICTNLEFNKIKDIILQSSFSNKAQTGGKGSKSSSDKIKYICLGPGNCKNKKTKGLCLGYDKEKCKWKKDTSTGLEGFSDNKSNVSSKKSSRITPNETNKCFSKEFNNEFMGCIVTGHVRHKNYPKGTNSKLQGILLEKGNEEGVYKGIGYLERGKGEPFWLTWDESYSGGIYPTKSEDTRIVFKDWYNKLVKNKSTRIDTIQKLVRDGMPIKTSKLIPKKFELDDNKKVTPFGLGQKVTVEEDKSNISEDPSTTQPNNEISNKLKEEELDAEQIIADAEKLLEETNAKKHTIAEEKNKTEARIDNINEILKTIENNINILSVENAELLLKKSQDKHNEIKTDKLTTEYRIDNLNEVLKDIEKSEDELRLDELDIKTDDKSSKETSEVPKTETSEETDTSKETDTETSKETKTETSKETKTETSKETKTETKKEEEHHTSDLKTEIIFNVKDEYKPNFNIEEIKNDTDKLLLENREVEQSYLALGFRTTGLNTEDKYILDILKIILAGNMSSILFTNLRENNGITYNVSIDHSSFEQHGGFTILTSVDREKLVVYREKKDGNEIKREGALPIIINSFVNLCNKGINKSQLELAKGYLKGTIALEAEDIHNISLFNGKNHLLNITNKNISLKNLHSEIYSKISIEKVNKVISKYFKRYNMYMYLIGKNIVFQRNIIESTKLTYDCNVNKKIIAQSIKDVLKI